MEHEKLYKCVFTLNGTLIEETVYIIAKGPLLAQQQLRQQHPGMSVQIVSLTLVEEE